MGCKLFAVKHQLDVDDDRMSAYLPRHERTPPISLDANRLGDGPAGFAPLRREGARLHCAGDEAGVARVEEQDMAEDASDLVIRYLGSQGFHQCPWRPGGTVPEVCVCAPNECQARGIRAPIMVRFPVPSADGGFE